MCDYSLMAVPNRLAREGEDLILYEFPTGTRGFTSDTSKPAVLPKWRNTLRVLADAVLGVQEAGKVAVCIPPGARLLLLDVPADLRTAERLACDAEVTFTQISATANRHRDAIRFDNGHELLLQLLDTGQRIRVLEIDLENQDEPSSPPIEFLRMAERRIDFIAPRLIR